MSEDAETEDAATEEQAAGDDNEAETADHGTDEGSEATVRDRATSPMQDYSTSQVTTGFVVLLVGVAVAYVAPSLL